MVTIDQLLHSLVWHQGSHLYLKPERPPIVRVLRDLVELDSEQLTAEQTRQLCYSTVSEGERVKFESELDSEGTYEIVGLGRFALHLYMASRSICGTFKNLQAPEKRTKRLFGRGDYGNLGCDGSSVHVPIGPGPRTRAGTDAKETPLSEFDDLDERRI
jgi:Tfp pilus assembly pilus retraction ATPase PilT